MNLFYILLCYVACHHASAVIVSVEQGKLRGELKWTLTGDNTFYSFKGIRYAAAPVGNLRFKAPQPAPAWEGIQNATEHGSRCVQFDLLSMSFIEANEDCLFLNVYTPSLNKESRMPVMFVIHGGAFISGSGNDDMYGPHHLIDQNNVVVVTINYRLDNLGFLCLHTAEVPGNAALKDQVAALRWVQKNIHNFGGDPNQVTLFGESAGGMSCMLHALSPMSRGLFHRIIAMSGEASNDYIDPFEPQRRPFVLAKSLGFEGAEEANTSAVLEFLQSVPALDLVFKSNESTILAVEQYTGMKFYYAVPVVEKDFGQERFLTESYAESIKKGLSNVDILMGFVEEEGIFFIPLFEGSTLENHSRFPEALVPLSISRRCTPEETLEIADSMKEHYTGSKAKSLNTIPLFTRLITDTFIYPVIRYANILSKYSPNNKMYLYENSMMSERNQLRELGNKYGLTGMSHFDDLQYIFQSFLYHSSVDKSAPSYQMIRTWCAIVTNFVIYGGKRPPLPVSHQPINGSLLTSQNEKHCALVYCAVPVSIGRLHTPLRTARTLRDPTPDDSLGVRWPLYNRRTKKYLHIGEELQVSRNPRQSTVDFYNTIYPEI